MTGSTPTTKTYSAPNGNIAEINKLNKTSFNSSHKFGVFSNEINLLNVNKVVCGKRESLGRLCL